MSLSKTAVESLLTAYGQALSEGDLRQIAKSWAIPALVLKDDASVPITSSSEIEELFAGSVEQYHQQGLASKRPFLENMKLLSANLAAVGA
ncbi:MAG: hypothetical protein H7Y12_11995 [Sphingobacteriaceae bacterium]|nr:hypothetical protein [Cytophagaceae bacterium]